MRKRRAKENIGGLACLFKINEKLFVVVVRLEILAAKAETPMHDDVLGEVEHICSTTSHVRPRGQILKTEQKKTNKIICNNSQYASSKINFVIEDT